MDAILNLWAWISSIALVILGTPIMFVLFCLTAPFDKGRYAAGRFLRIVGITAAGKGATIHTIDCETLDAFSDSPERWVDVSWESGAQAGEQHIARIKAVLRNAPGSLATLATVIARNQGNINNLKFTDRNPDFFEMHVDIEVADLKHLTNILAALRIDPAIASVERLRG